VKKLGNKSVKSINKASIGAKIKKIRVGQSTNQKHMEEGKDL
jgi:hypothetical protein